MEKLAGDVDKGSVTKQIDEIKEKMAQVDVEHIFNLDETGLFYRCFPRGTYVTQAETVAGVSAKTARGSKAMKAKDRVTVIACCNTTGSLRVPVAVIGVSQNPVVFRHVGALPTL